MQAVRQEKGETGLEENVRVSRLILLKKEIEKVAK